MGGPHTKTRRHSKIESLPLEKQEELNRLLIEGFTYEEIEAHFRQQGHELSRSGIGRYGKGFLEAVRKTRIISDKAKTLVSEAGSDSLVLEEAGSKLLSEKIIALLLENDVTPKSVTNIMIGFSMLQKASIAREKFKVDLKDRVTKAAADVTKIAKKGGLSDEAADLIKAKILGIVK